MVAGNTLSASLDKCAAIDGDHLSCNDARPPVVAKIVNTYVSPAQRTTTTPLRRFHAQRLQNALATEFVTAWCFG